MPRRQPAAHKRWMCLATIAVLWPAIFRWRHLLPPMSRPDIVLGLFVLGTIAVTLLLVRRPRLRARLRPRVLRLHVKVGA